MSLQPGSQEWSFLRGWTIGCYRQSNCFWLTKIEVSNVVHPNQTFLFLSHFVHVSRVKKDKAGRKERSGRTDGEGSGLRLCSLLSGTVCWLEAELGPFYFIPSSCPVVIFPPFPTFSEVEMWHIFPRARSDKCFFEEEPNYKTELATPKRAQVCGQTTLNIADLV